MSIINGIAIWGKQKQKLKAKAFNPVLFHQFCLYGDDAEFLISYLVKVLHSAVFF